MGTVGVQTEDLGVHCLSARTGLCSDSEGAVYNVSQCQQQQQRSETLTQDDENLDVIQTKMFKRRRLATAVLDGDPGRALPPKCCHRCKSDLNGKLMVRCATCSFRCHLYCFSPSLKQHPAFLIRRQQQQIGGQNDLNDTSPVWKCEKCEGTSVVFNVKPRPSSPVTRSLTKTPPRSTPVKQKSDTQAHLTTTSAIAEEQDAGWIQPQWLKNADVVFDWYRFRAEKTEVLRYHETDANQNRGGVDELIFYSKSYALMKKIAAIWRGRILKRRHRHQQGLETKAMNYPGVKRNVMCVRIATEKDTAKVVSKDTLCGEEEDVNLVEDMNQYRPYSRRPPRLPILWEGEPPSALTCWTTGERSEVSDVLAEIEERVCLAIEDADAPPPTKEMTIDTLEDVTVTSPAGPNVHNLRCVNVRTAAAIIQRIFARHHIWRRRTDRANRQRRVVEEAERRAKARSSVALLRTCIQFIVLLVRMLSQTQKKKAMLMVLRDAAEETQVKNSTLTMEQEETEDAARLARERIQQLSVVRICRFFIRRVHPYVKLKKTVMARRLQRWWKRKTYMYKWRDIAIAIRLTHKSKSCARIQRFYRQTRARARFCALIEKHALKKLRRALTSWLFSRLARKEAKRSAAYEAVQLTITEENSIPQDASLDEILEKRGMDLYQQGDFWNAASILERLCEMRTGKLTRELQQTLAYSHHMTWYTSYDQFNLNRAHELYCASLEDAAKGERAARVDPSVLHGLAIVMMHMEHFGDSLRLLAKLIEYFARQPQFPLWLLLAAVQLQQCGEWEQSVGYLTYLHDIPPTPYLERDILALCAIGYEQLGIAASKSSEGPNSNSNFAKEAWRAALRQWHLEKVTVGEVDGSARGRGNGRALTSRQKWELLTNLGRRALDQGHYLLACRVYIYALEREAPASDLSSPPYSYYYEQEKRAAWWNLADAFRHLGHLDLYLNAAQRSQAGSSAEQVDEYLELASQQASSFETELRTLTVLEKLRQLAGNAK